MSRGELPSARVPSPGTQRCVPNCWSSIRTRTLNDDCLTLAGGELIEFLRGHERAITALERMDEAVFLRPARVEGHLQVRRRARHTGHGGHGPARRPSRLDRWRQQALGLGTRDFVRCSAPSLRPPDKCRGPLRHVASDNRPAAFRSCGRNNRLRSRRQGFGTLAPGVRLPGACPRCSRFPGFLRANRSRSGLFRDVARRGGRGGRCTCRSTTARAIC